MNIISKYGQKEIVDYLHTISKEEQQNILEQFEQIHIDALLLQKALLHQPQHQNREISPLYHFSRAGNEENAKKGHTALEAGQVGCLLLAGGQGTRLGFSGPKGMYPVTPIKNKSLFQVFAEKTAAASRQAQTPLSLAIMTSPINHDETVQFFIKNNYFGLNSQQVSFFNQGMLPFLDIHGSLFLSSKNSLAQGPDGNGDALYHFVHSGIWKQWLHHGIRYVNVVLVDNPLADPFDAELIGYTIEQKADVVIKSTLRTDEKENVGVLALEKGKIVVVEYTEISPEAYTSKNDSGDLNYNCANLGLFCLGMDFIKNSSQHRLPLHKAFKASSFVNALGDVIQPSEPNSWKFERYIFDILPYSSKTEVLVYPRESCFAPLKNRSGPSSLETVQEALQKRDIEILRSLTKKSDWEFPLEISQEFYYPTKEMFLEIKDKKFPKNGYISMSDL